MREAGLGIACVLGFVVVLIFFSRSFDSATKTPVQAMETAKWQADLAAAKAEAEKTRAELESARGDLKKAHDANEDLRRKVTDLTRQLAAKAK